MRCAWQNVVTDPDDALGQERRRAVGGDEPGALAVGHEAGDAGHVGVGRLAQEGRHGRLAPLHAQRP